MSQCPNAVGFFQGLSYSSESALGVKTKLSCNSWDCPVCGPRKIKFLRRRIFNGGLAVEGEMAKGFRNKYSQKFLTLTCPGDEWRLIHSIQDAYKIFSRNFDKLMRALKKHYGNFYYLRVVEPQQDGFPHYHVLLIGRAVSSIAFRDSVEALWRYKYEMGFVRLNVIVRSLVHGVRYLTKYLTKSEGFKVPVAGMRLFSASRGALEPIKKRRWDMSHITIGFCNRNDDEIREYDIDPDNVDELLALIEKDFFRFRGRTKDDIDSLERQVQELLEEEV